MIPLQLQQSAADVCQLSVVSVPQFTQAMTSVLWAFALGGVITVFFGGMLRDFFFTFVMRRFRSWRPMVRAMSRLFRRDGQ